MRENFLISFFRFKLRRMRPMPRADAFPLQRGYAKEFASDPAAGTEFPPLPTKGGGFRRKFQKMHREK